MKSKFIVLNVLLAAGIVAAIWQVNVRWNRASAERHANLNVQPKPVTVTPVAPLPKPESPAPAQYAQVAEKNLFSSDRNPTVVVEQAKVEPPKPMPSLPVVYGVMGLPSGARAIMAEKSGQQSRSIRAGDTIGEFKVLALDTQNVKFEWEGKEVAKRIEDLVDRSNAQPGTQDRTGPPPPPPTANNPVQPKPIETNTSRELGVVLTDTMRACRDLTPTTAVVDGYKKVLTPSPFGTVCRWVK